MSKQSQRIDAQRRNFLRGTVATATGVAVTAIAAKSLTGVAEADTGDRRETYEGYRLTKHIADYYKSAAV